MTPRLGRCLGRRQTMVWAPRISPNKQAISWTVTNLLWKRKRLKEPLEENTSPACKTWHTLLPHLLPRPYGPGRFTRWSLQELALLQLIWISKSWKTTAWVKQKQNSLLTFPLRYVSRSIRSNVFTRQTFALGWVAVVDLQKLCLAWLLGMHAFIHSFIHLFVHPCSCWCRYRYVGSFVFKGVRC